MRRAQISIDTLILLAALAFAALVILIIVFPSFKQALEGASEKGACEWSLVMHSIAKLGDWSLIPPECRAHRFEVTMDDLKSYETEAKSRIRMYHDVKTRHKYEHIAEIFKNPDKDIYWQEWALNKIIATEMKDCWEKVFKGRLPLFEKWWRLYSWDPVTGVPDNQETAFKLWFPLIGTQRIHYPPVNCIICSRIKFSDEVKNAFIKENKVHIDSLDPWLKNNYPTMGGKSYYEILAEGRSELKGLTVPKYEFSMDEPLAVLYEKIHYYHGAEVFLAGVWDYLFGDLSEDAELDFLKLVPYTQEALIHQPKQDGTGGEGCTFILD